MVGCSRRGVRCCITRLATPSAILISNWCQINNRATLPILVPVDMMKSEELQTKISHADSLIHSLDALLILSLILYLCDALSFTPFACVCLSVCLSPVLVYLDDQVPMQVQLLLAADVGVDARDNEQVICSCLHPLLLFPSVAAVSIHCSCFHPFAGMHISVIPDHSAGLPVCIYVHCAALDNHRRSLLLFGTKHPIHTSYSVQNRHRRLLPQHPTLSICTHVHCTALDNHRRSSLHDADLTQSSHRPHTEPKAQQTPRTAPKARHIPRIVPEAQNRHQCRPHTAPRNFQVSKHQGWVISCCLQATALHLVGSAGDNPKIAKTLLNAGVCSLCCLLCALSSVLDSLSTM